MTRSSRWLSFGVAVVVAGGCAGHSSRSEPTPSKSASIGRLEVDDETYEKLSQAAAAITGAIEDARAASPITAGAFDSMTSAELIRDLHGPHGAACDRPDLDRAMIEALTPSR